MEARDRIDLVVEGQHRTTSNNGPNRRGPRRCEIRFSYGQRGNKNGKFWLPALYFFLQFAVFEWSIILLTFYLSKSTRKLAMALLITKFLRWPDMLVKAQRS